MNGIFIYSIIGILMFAIGLLAGYLTTTEYYKRRFVIVAKECHEGDSIGPLLDELERES